MANTQEDRVSKAIQDDLENLRQRGNPADQKSSSTPAFDGQWPPHPDYLAGLQGYARGLSISDLNNPFIPYHGTLRFYSLQHTCQELNDLSKKTLDGASATRDDLERLRLLLHEQAVAMKDLEYINEHLLGVSEEAFVKNSNVLSDNNLSTGHDTNGWLYGAPNTRSIGSELELILRRHLPKWITWSSSEKKSQPSYYAKGNSPREVSKVVRVISSTILSLCSGASIIVPMIVMSFDQSKDKSLIVVSVAVVLFSFVLGAVVQAKSENVFIATATYAAVLVVFVGVSGSNS
ncbi:hypothetical protein VTL71DRAFT_128 [Oculimacula yallundae]|uniref:DUF6594 domain-containing protein n=1 Tax=Oculimacula yallundae TaxID=86028 RepID=A0ABR4D096_9HELO